MKRPFGENSKRETPVPIPNTEVKSLSADGTELVTAWESRTSPNKGKGRIGPPLEPYTAKQGFAFFIRIWIILGSSMVEHSAVNR